MTKTDKKTKQERKRVFAGELRFDQSAIAYINLKKKGNICELEVVGTEGTDYYFKFNP